MWLSGGACVEVASNVQYTRHEFSCFAFLRRVIWGPGDEGVDFFAQCGATVEVQLFWYRLVPQHVVPFFQVELGE